MLKTYALLQLRPDSIDMCFIFIQQLCVQKAIMPLNNISRFSDEIQWLEV